MLDKIIDNLRFGHDADPPDVSVVRMLAQMCDADPSLDSHVVSFGHANTPWRAIRATAAGHIYEMYLKETEAATWP